MDTDRIAASARLLLQLRPTDLVTTAALLERLMSELETLATFAAADAAQSCASTAAPAIAGWSIAVHAIDGDEGSAATRMQLRCLGLLAIRDVDGPGPAASPRGHTWRSDLRGRRPPRASSERARQQSRSPSPSSGPSSAAVCLTATSGSEGAQRVVVWGAAELLHRLEWQLRCYPMQPGSVAAVTAQSAFADSVMTQWVPIASGACRDQVSDHSTVHLVVVRQRRGRLSQVHLFPLAPLPGARKDDAAGTQAAPPCCCN